MNWTRFALTVLASGIVSSLTDWLFMGDLLYIKNDNQLTFPSRRFYLAMYLGR